MQEVQKIAFDETPNYELLKGILINLNKVG